MVPYSIKTKLTSVQTFEDCRLGTRKLNFGHSKNTAPCFQMGVSLPFPFTAVRLRESMNVCELLQTKENWLN